MADKGPLEGTAIILAGGRSSRMTAPKPFMKVGGVPLIERQAGVLKGLFRELLVVSDDVAAYMRLGLRTVPDAEPFRGIGGPMAGIYTGLTEMAGGYGFVIACDMPFIRPGLVRWMADEKAGHDAVLPRIGGYVEPLMGFYSRRAAEVFRKALEGGERSIQRVLGELDVRFVGAEEMKVHDPGLVSIINLNTPEDLRKAERLVEAEGRAV